MSRLLSCFVGLATLISVSDARCADQTLPAFESALQTSGAAIREATAAHEQAVKKLESLTILSAQGHASVFETEKAAAKVTETKAKLQACRQFQSFVKSLMKDEAAIDALRSDRYDGQPKLLVTIPGLSDAIGCLEVGSLTVPVTDELVQMTMEINRLKSGSSNGRGPNAEMRLLGELLYRLKQGAGTPNEIQKVGGQLRQAEATVARIAAERTAIEGQQQLLEELQQSSGERYRLNSDVALALQMESLRQQNTAQTVAYSAQRDFRERHLARLMAIADSGAVPRAEMQQSDFQVQYLNAMLASTKVAAKRLEHEQQMFAQARQQKDTATDATVAVSLNASKLPSALSHITDEYLRTAMQSARERLIQPAEVDAARRRLENYREYVIRIGHNADDKFFTGEFHRSQMLADVAAGAVAELQYKQKARQLEYLYVNALETAHRGEGSFADVLTALEDLFSHQANLEPLKQAVKARVAYQTWKAERTQELNASRNASWLEMARRNRDLEQTKAELATLKTRTKIRSLELKRIQAIRKMLQSADQKDDSLAAAEE